LLEYVDGNSFNDIDDRVPMKIDLLQIHHLQIYLMHIFMVSVLLEFDFNTTNYYELLYVDLIVCEEMQ